MPVLVQPPATLRNDGNIALSTPPTPGSLLVLVTGGFFGSLGSYRPQGFIRAAAWKSNDNNGVMFWIRRAVAGDSGSYDMSASDNQGAVLYEYADASGLFPVNGGGAAEDGHLFSFYAPPEPFDGKAVGMIVLTHDTTPGLYFYPRPGLTQDYMTPPSDSLNHPSVFGRITPEAVGAITGETTGGGLNNSAFGMAYLVGAPAA
ncbi:hypothetical protein [Novosphingobium panipatense]